jgi:hypothetical protein
MFCLPKVLTRIPVMFLEFLQHYQRLVIFIQTVPSHRVTLHADRPCNALSKYPGRASASLEVQHVKPVVCYHLSRGAAWI